ncbi:MAG: DNA-processing protein DprA [Fibrobacter sp.]|nr:DNA-processing protein DprA [Fibrobacter sp.]
MDKDRKYTEIDANEFPLSLAQSKFSPKRLYVAGSIPKATKDGTPLVGIAMVGTRRPSSSATELCRRLVFSLKGTNAVIVSGLAQGIDSLCHEAAIEAGLPTIAVLAQGLATHVEGSRGDLLERILDAGGAVISQFEPDVPAYKGNFIARNKIISGLCQATVIVQSKKKGGALLTAGFCIEEQKTLLAVPGNFDSEVAAGPNALLDSGKAEPIFIPESLRKLVGIQEPEALSLHGLPDTGCTLSEPARELFTQMRGFRKTIDDIERSTSLKTAELLAILTELEIAGLISTQDNFQFYFDGAF